MMDMLPLNNLLKSLYSDDDIDHSYVNIQNYRKLFISKFDNVFTYISITEQIQKKRICIKGKYRESKS